MSSRCRMTCWMIGLTTVLVACAGFADQKLFREATEKAAKAEKQKNWAEADRAFVDAVTHAKGDLGLTSRAALAGAINLETLLVNQPDQITAEQTQRLIGWYELTREQGSESQKALACNNLGVYYVRQKKYPQAVQEFGRMANSKEANAVYNFNFGRAHQLAGNPQSALTQFAEALAKDGDFARAATMARELIAAQGVTQRVRLARGFFERLLPATAGSAAPGAASANIGRLLYSLIEVLQTDPENESLSPYVLRYLVRSRVDAQRFIDVDWPVLKTIDKNSGLTVPLKALNDIFTAKLTNGRTRIVLPSEDVYSQFPECRKIVDAGGTNYEVAWLLKVAADGFTSRARDMRKFDFDAPRRALDLDAAREALLRYTASFALDDGNPDPALQAASIFVGEIGLRIDPGHDDLNRFTNAVFERKSSLFATAQTKEQLVALSLFHVVLGTIYEKRPGRPGSAETALFQWKHAVYTEDRIRKLDPTYPPSPVLRQHLASAYLNEGNREAAVKLCAEAMLMLVDAGQLNTAKEYYQELTANASPWQLSDEHRSQLAANLTNGRNLSSLRALADVRGPKPFLLLGMRNTEEQQFMLFAGTPGVNGQVTRCAWSRAGQQINVESIPVIDQTVICSYEGGRFLFTGLNALDTWTPMRWKPPPVIENRGIVFRLEIVDDGKLTVAKTAEGAITVWDSRLMKIYEREMPTRLFSLSADGRQLALVDADGLFAMDVRTGETLYRVTPTFGTISAMGFSPDNSWLICGKSNGRIEIREAVTGKEVQSFLGHNSAIETLAFAPGNKLLSTLSPGDSSVRIWDLKSVPLPSEKPLVQLPQHGQSLTAVFSPDGNWISVSFATDNTGLVKTWDLSKLTER